MDLEPTAREKQFRQEAREWLRAHVEKLPSPLPKDEFLKLYRKCDDALHRGSVSKLLKGQFPTRVDYPEITAKVQKLVDLLSVHAIVTAGGELVFLAILKNANDNSRPQVAIAETLPGQPLDFASPDFLRGKAPK